MSSGLMSMVDPLETQYPDIIEHTMYEGVSVCCAFNRRGTLLATGCKDGLVVIWDFETFSVASRLRCHDYAITCLSWSRCGKYLASADTHGVVCLWNVANGKREKKIEFRQATNYVSLHPLNRWDLVVSTPKTEPMLVYPRVPGTLVPKLIQFSKDSNKHGRDEFNVLATYDVRATKLLVGSDRNTLTSYDPNTLERLQQTSVGGVGRVTDISCSRDNAYIVMNSSDRVLRVFSSKTFQVLRELQDAVNRVHWNSCAFGSNAEFVIAVPAGRENQKVFIWNRVYGQIARILEGPKDNTNHMVCHPQRPVIVTCGGDGMLYVWTKSYLENWSAFAPDFEQLDENVEYIEKEEEFDLVTDDSSKKLQQEEHVDDLDLFTVEDSDEFSACEDELVHLPVLPLVSEHAKNVQSTDATTTAPTTTTEKQDGTSDAKTDQPKLKKQRLDDASDQT